MLWVFLLDEIRIRPSPMTYFRSEIKQLRIHRHAYLHEQWASSQLAEAIKPARFSRRQGSRCTLLTNTTEASHIAAITDKPRFCLHSTAELV